jgi:hypothetical protein
MVQKEAIKGADEFYINLSEEIFKSNRIDVSKDELNKVSRVLSAYPPNIANVFSFWLRNVGCVTRNKEDVMNAVKKLESHELNNLFSKYSFNSIVSEKIASKFGNYLMTIKNSDAGEIDKIAGFFADHEVYNFIVKSSKSKNKSKLQDSEILENLASEFFEIASLIPNERVKNFVFSEIKKLEKERIPIGISEEFSKIAKVFSAMNTVPRLGQRTLSTLSTLPDFEKVFLKLSEINDNNEIRELAYLLNNSVSEYNDILSNWNKVKRSLKLNYNIDFFGRYPWRVLKAMSENEDKRIKEKPLAVLIYNKSDHNGAFYYDYKVISQLSNEYDVRIIEAATDREFETWSLIMKQKYDKADLVVIAGHGSPTSIRFGGGSGPEYSLDLTDEGSFIALSELLKEGGQIVLFACSTGDRSSNQSLANIISANVHASAVFAPDKPTGPSEILLKKIKRKGTVQSVRVAEVKYTKGAYPAVYSGGELKNK